MFARIPPITTHLFLGVFKLHIMTSFFLKLILFIRICKKKQFFKIEYIYVCIYFKTTTNMFRNPGSRGSRLVRRTQIISISNELLSVYDLSQSQFLSPFLLTPSSFSPVSLWCLTYLTVLDKNNNKIIRYNLVSCLSSQKRIVIVQYQINIFWWRPWTSNWTITVWVI